jgi:hypothetical protein
MIVILNSLMQYEEEQGKEEDIQRDLEDNPEEVAVL